MGQERRGRAGSHHLLCEPVGWGPNGVRRRGGSERADRQRGDRGGVQGDRQAAALRLGGEVDRGGWGGGAEPSGLELHVEAVESVLVEGGSLGVPGCRLSKDQNRLYINPRSNPR